MKTIQPLTQRHPEAVAAIEQLVTWTTEDGCRLSLRFVGDPGVGKSDLAEAFIQSVVSRGRPGLYVNARSLLLRLQGSFRNDAAESTDVIINRYATVTFLAIDDLGSTKPSRFTSDCLYELLERRTRNQLPTVVTANYVSLADLAQRLAPSDGDALDSIRPVDRIDELTPRVIVLRGASQRPLVSRPDGKLLAAEGRG